MHILQIMFIKKSIRLCIDPKDLNEALEREPYYSRTIDELISMFAGAKVFTIVDMDKGYWASCVASWIQKADLHGIWHRKVSIQEITNGFQGC